MKKSELREEIARLIIKTKLLEKDTKMNIWVKIKKPHLKNEEDATLFSKIQKKHKGNFNTHSEKSMYFDFESSKNAFDFAKDVVTNFSYLKISMGQVKV